MGSRAILLAALLSVAALAGCTDDPAPSAPATTTDPDPTPGTATGGGTGTGTGTGTGGGAGNGAPAPKPTTTVPPNAAGCRFETCIAGHVYAPLWELGRTWTYDVTGAYYPSEDYQATVGVFKVNDDHYLMGTSSPEELKNSAGKIGVMTGPVQKDSYGVLEHEEYQDLLGFLKLKDTAWDIKLWDLDFTISKGGGIDITHAQGTSLGFQVTGATADGHQLFMEYASDVAWLTKLEWTNPEGAIQVSYTLTDYAMGAPTADLKIWDTAGWTVVRGFGNTLLTSVPTRWTLADPGSFVFIRVITDEPISTAEGRVITPARTIQEFSHSGGDVEDRTLPFEAGEWVIQSVSDRGRATEPTGPAQMAIWLYHIVERAP